MVHAFKTTIITTWTKLGHPTFPQTKSKSTGNSHSIVFINITFTKYMGSGTWKYKSRKSLQEFKRLIKVWKPETCPCRMCEKYVANIAFIWLNIKL